MPPIDNNILMLLLMVPFIAIFYFLSIRPETQRRTAAEKMRSELSVGDVITTLGGVRGTICAVKEDVIVIESGADRVRIEFIKEAVSTKGAKAAESTDTDKK